MLSLATCLPGLAVRPQLAQWQIMQHPVRDATTGDWYVSQACAGSAYPRESTSISRCTPQGGLVSAMVCEDYGHGTCIGLDRRPDGLWIWLWRAVTSELVRVKWREVPGQKILIVRAGDPDQVVIPPIPVTIDGTTYPDPYTLAAIDGAEICCRVRPLGTFEEIYQLRLLADLEAGVDDVLAEVGPFDADDWMQGFTYADGTLIRLNGSPQEADPYRPWTLDVWDLVTGCRLHTVSVDHLGYEPDGTPLQGRREPEGVSASRNPDGSISVFLGVTTGWSQYRQHKVYELTGTGASLAAEVEALGSWLRVDRVGRSKLPGAYTSLAELSLPADYYVSTAAFATMTDRPSDATASAHHLLTFGASPTGDRVQALVRNTGGDNGRAWLRIVNPVSGTRSPWMRLSLAAVPY